MAPILESLPNDLRVEFWSMLSKEKTAYTQIPTILVLATVYLGRDGGRERWSRASQRTKRQCQIKVGFAWRDTTIQTDWCSSGQDGSWQSEAIQKRHWLAEDSASGAPALAAAGPSWRCYQWPRQGAEAHRRDLLRLSDRIPGA